MTLMQKIQFHAKEKGYTLAALDRACGFSHGTIRRLDTVAPSVEKVASVARVLDISIDYLCGRTDSPSEFCNVPDSPDARYITDDDLRFALFSGKPATEAQLREVKRFAAFVMQRDSDQ